MPKITTDWIVSNGNITHRVFRGYSATIRLCCADVVLKIYPLDSDNRLDGITPIFKGKFLSVEQAKQSAERYPNV